MEILEVKHTLKGERKEFPCELCLLEPGHAIVLYRLKRDVNLEGVAMPAGTLSFGHYWEDRPFNVYHWLYVNGQTAAYYINLADSTSVREGRIEWRDLVLDVLIEPGEAPRVLDEDELPGILAPDLRAKIDGAVAYLLANHEQLMAEVERDSRRFLGNPER